MNTSNFNYQEDEILAEVEGYIASTYGEHYAGNRDIQLFDYWQSLGIMTPVAIGTAMKYLARYGKKEGSNRKDLLKAMHYTILALWSEDQAGELVEYDAEEAYEQDVGTDDERGVYTSEDSYVYDGLGEDELDDDSFPSALTSAEQEFSQNFQQFLDALFDPKDK